MSEAGQSPPPEPERAPPPGPPPASAELLRVLGDALLRTSGVLGDGVEDLRRQLGPVWEGAVAGFGVGDLSRKLDEIAEALARSEAAARDEAGRQRVALEGLLEASSGPTTRPDDNYFFAQLEAIEGNLKKVVEQAIRRQLEASRPGPTPKPAPPRGREAVVVTAPEPDGEQVAALARLREEVEASRVKVQEAEAQSRKHENEKVNHQTDLQRAREDLARWRALALGEDLPADSACAGECERLTRDALAGQPAAVSLLGHWMTFRTVAPDRLPMLIRQIGEAYYAWRPRTQPGPADDDPMEAALVRALHARCERAGVRNKVEVLRPNSRFDSGRHESDGGGGGTAVVEVRGWLVLKADGAVIYRAKVAAR